MFDASALFSSSCLLSVVLFSFDGLSNHSFFLPNNPGLVLSACRFFTRLWVRLAGLVLAAPSGQRTARGLRLIPGDSGKLAPEIASAGQLLVSR